MYKVREMYILKPTTCNGTNVVQLQLVTEKQIKHMECVNGFGIIGFLIALMERLKDPTPDDIMFLSKLKELQLVFDVVFSHSTADTSRFALNL